MACGANTCILFCNSLIQARHGSAEMYFSHAEVVCLPPPVPDPPPDPPHDLQGSPPDPLPVPPPQSVLDPHFRNQSLG